MPGTLTVPSRKWVSPTREYSAPFSLVRTVIVQSLSTSRIASSAASPAALAPMITWCFLAALAMLLPSVL